MESARAQARLNKFIMYLVLVIMAFIMLVPFAWMILTAVKTNQESISVNPFYIFPQSGWHWENFGKVWQSYNFITLYKNTLLMIFFRVVCACLTATMAGYAFGRLPWRTLRFERETLSVADYQGTSVVNYVDAEVPYTRIHEFKHYHPEQKAVMAAPKTVIMREYSAAWKPGDEPYYPIDNAESRALCARYAEEAAKVPGLVVGGRLGAYKYFDMDRSIEAALALAL